MACKMGETYLIHIRKNWNSVCNLSPSSKAGLQLRISTQVTVTEEHNIFVIKQSKSKYATFDITASNFTDNTFVLGSTAYSSTLSCTAFQICDKKNQ
jgi:hypothetical protein